MKPPRHQHPLSAQGSVLAVAMIMTLLAGLFIAGWMSLASMRAAYARNTATAAMRRLMLENSKVYSQQVARQNALNGSGLLPAVASTLTDGTNLWGGVDTLSGWSGLQPYALPNVVSYPAAGLYSTLFPFNGTGLRPGASFLATQSLQRPAAFQDMMDPFTGYLFLKSINPCVAGDAMVIYRKPDNEPGQTELAPNILINGRLVVRDPACFFPNTQVNLGAKVRLSAPCKSLYLQKYDTLNRVSGTNASNGTDELMPSNMPAVPSTYGPLPGLTNGGLYGGYLNIIQNSANPANSLWDIQQREATAGRTAYTTISLGAATGLVTDPYYIVDETNPPFPPPQWPSGYPRIWKVLYVKLNHPNLTNLRIYGVVNQIVFLGQSTSAEYSAASSLNPVTILVVPDPITTLTVQAFAFVRENSRPIILGTKGNHHETLNLFWTGGTIPSVPTPLTADWRLLLINEYCQVTLYPPTAAGVNAVSMVGGILTNWSIKRKVDGGVPATFTISPEWNGGYALASLLPRDAWLESYFQLTPP